ncbi:hypothetical protein ABZS86_17765 [Streptomyces sp. NPDC005355]|uniref:hypothetical protein n=1 Tax=Streptomyces sp. NPDC005355 TaxID=3157038 RepID=UPI0033A8D66C
MLLRLAYLGVTNAFAMLRLLPMGDRDKAAEILALRHQIMVLERLGKARVRFTPSSWLDALRDSELVPEHQDLDVFRRTRPGKQRKPSEELARELVIQTYRYDPA